MIRYFKSTLTPDMTYCIPPEQWKAVDFRFICHEGIRASAEEDAVRRTLD